MVGHEFISHKAIDERSVVEKTQRQLDGFLGWRLGEALGKLAA
jgi:hypothetical protein